MPDDPTQAKGHVIATYGPRSERIPWLLCQVWDTEFPKIPWEEAKGLITYSHG